MINNKIQFPLDWTKKDYKSDGLLKGTTRLLIEGLGSGPRGVCACVCVCVCVCVCDAGLVKMVSCMQRP